MITDLVIPMLNEAENVPRLFEALAPLRKSGAIRHVVVGDNGSTDDTPDLVRKHGGVVTTETRRGYGGACLAATRWIAQQDKPPDAIAFIDADLSDHPRDLVLLLDALEDHDLAIGNRRRLAKPGALNFVQRFGNSVATAMIFLVTGKHYNDLGPMRAIRWPMFVHLDMRDRSWGWTVEMQSKAAIARLRVAQIDVPYYKREIGESKISGSIIGAMKAGWKIITTILLVRLTWRPRRSALSTAESGTSSLTSSTPAD